MSVLAYNIGLNNNNNYDIKPKLLLDSGASEHYTFNKDWLLNYKPIYNKSVTIANGQDLPVLGQGDIPIKVVYNNNYKDILIKNVYYIPKLKATLISSKELTNKG